jgi:hypothetical protein
MATTEKYLSVSTINIGHFVHKHVDIPAPPQDRRTTRQLRTPFYLLFISFFFLQEAARVAIEEAITTIDHSDIRGSEPHNRNPSGAASD